MRLLRSQLLLPLSNLFRLLSSTQSKRDRNKRGGQGKRNPARPALGFPRQIGFAGIKHLKKYLGYPCHRFFFLGLIAAVGRVSLSRMNPADIFKCSWVLCSEKFARMLDLLAPYLVTRIIL